MEKEILNTLFSHMGDMYTKLFTLGAIWVKIDTKMRRVTIGDKVTVADGKIIGFENPTHTVIKCMGTITDSVLEFTLRDLGNNDTLILKV